MTAQGRYGRSTIDAAHKLEQEPADSLTDALITIVLGCVAIAVLGGAALFAAHLGVNLLDLLGGR